MAGFSFEVNMEMKWKAMYTTSVVKSIGLEKS